MRDFSTLSLAAALLAVVTVTAAMALRSHLPAGPPEPVRPASAPAPASSATTGDAGLPGSRTAGVREPAAGPAPGGVDRTGALSRASTPAPRDATVGLPAKPSSQSGAEADASPGGRLPTAESPERASNPFTAPGHATSPRFPVSMSTGNAGQQPATAPALRALDPGAADLTATAPAPGSRGGARAAPAPGLQDAGAGRPAAPGASPAHGSETGTAGSTAGSASPPRDELAEPTTVEDTSEHSPWRHPDCPMRLPPGSTKAQAEVIQSQYGCRYQQICIARNDGSGEMECWWGVRSYH